MRLASGVGARSLSTGKKPRARHSDALSRVDIQPGRVGGEQPRGIVDGCLARAAGQALPAGRLQLAGRVVAGVADDAAPVEDGLDVARVRLARQWLRRWSKRVGSEAPNVSSSVERAKVVQAATATTASAMAKRLMPARGVIVARGSRFDEVRDILVRARGFLRSSPSCLERHVQRRLYRCRDGHASLWARLPPRPERSAD